MVYIKPWNIDAERILRQLSLSGRAYSTDMHFVKKFATQKSVRELINQDFLDIAHNHRKKKSIFVIPPDITVIPKSSENGINFHFRRFKIF